MKILAIDPGTWKSALVRYDMERGVPVAKAHLPNAEVLAQVRTAYLRNEHLVIEMIASYGMPVGKDVFETIAWIGRFEEAWLSATRDDSSRCHRVFRREVKMHLCNTNRAKDSNVLHALYDRFGPGRQRAVGTKKEPGPCYGFSGDLWAALAVAVTFADSRKPPMPLVTEEGGREGRETGQSRVDKGAEGGR